MGKVVCFIKKNMKWLLFLIFMLLFLWVVERLFQNELDMIDENVYYFVMQYETPWMTHFMRFITNFGDFWAIFIITVLCFIFLKRHEAILIGSNAFLIWSFNLLFKHVFMRSRPDFYRLIPIDGYSFPSGHSMISVAFYGLLFYFIYRKISCKWVRCAFCFFILFLVFMIGISRIYLGVHYASDVLAGFCFSISYLIVLVHVIQKIRNE